VSGTIRNKRRLMALLLLPAMTAWCVAVAGEQTLRLGCIHDASDDILSIICQRVEREATMVAGAAGFRLAVVADGVGTGDPPAGGRTLEITLTATRPDSQFGTKRIGASLVGRFATDAATPWNGEIAAEGVPRDLVHPVADALLERIEVFLATPEPQ
jgi:hypothetical protein